VNPDTIGYVWTGEFDLNTLRVDGEIFESGKKKLRIQKYPDTCGRGFNSVTQPNKQRDIKKQTNKQTKGNNIKQTKADNQKNKRNQRNQRKQKTEI